MGIFEIHYQQNKQTDGLTNSKLYFCKRVTLMHVNNEVDMDMVD